MRRKDPWTALHWLMEPIILSYGAGEKDNGKEESHEEWVNRVIRAEWNASMAGYSMGATVGACQCEDCVMLGKHLSKKNFVSSGTSLDTASPNFKTVIAGMTQAGITTGRTSSSKPNQPTWTLPNWYVSPSGRAKTLSSFKSPWKPVPPKRLDLHVQEAMDKIRAVRADKKTRSGRRRELRILDHSSSWKEQGCSSRYSVIRWSGYNLPEWERVGWAIGAAVYTSRKDASRARKDLLRISDVMDC